MNRMVAIAVAAWLLMGVCAFAQSVSPGAGGVTSVAIAPTAGVSANVTNPTTTPTINVGISVPLSPLQGGTGVSSILAHGVVIGEGAGGISPAGPATAGMVLTANGGLSDPTFQTALSGPIYNCTANGGTANALTATCTGFTLTTGLGVIFTPGSQNSARAPTLAVNGLTATALDWFSPANGAVDAIPINYFIGGIQYVAIYDGTEFVVQLPAQSAMFVQSGNASGTANAVSFTLQGATEDSTPNYGGVFFSSQANTGSTTINPNTIGAQTLQKNTTKGLANLVAGDLAGNGDAYIFAKQGNNYTLINPTYSPGAEQALNYSPGLVTSISSTFGAFYKVVQASTVDNVIASAIALTCATSPVIELDDCGTSPTCASPTGIAGITVISTGTALSMSGALSSTAIAAGDLLAWRMPTGTCTAADLTGTAEIHAN